MDVGCIIPTMVQKGKIIKAEMCMQFYDDTKLLHLKTDACRIACGATVLQLKDNTVCQKVTAPDNTIL